MIDHRDFIRSIGDGTLALLTAVSTIGVVVSLAALIGASTPSYGQSDPPVAAASSATASSAPTGSDLYQRHDTVKSWRSTGTACSGASCPGRMMLDNNPATRTMHGAQP